MYSYYKTKSALFTEEIQSRFLQIRDRAHKLLDTSGAASMSLILAGVDGDNWENMACVDRLVELGELREISYGEVAYQNRIFVKNK